MKPGEYVLSFQTKSGKSAVIRYAQIEDAEALTDFINTISLEDTFVRFAGEQMTLEGEQKYLESEITKISEGDCVKLFCFVDGELAAISDVHRDTDLLTRRRHLGLFGLIVAKKYRGDGIGQKLMSTVIDESKKNITGLRQILLECFANNQPALALYTKIGFREIGRIPQGVYRKNEYVDEIIMRKTL